LYQGTANKEGYW